MLGNFRKISFRLPVIVILAAAVAAAAVGSVSYIESSNEVRRQLMVELESLRDSRHIALTHYLKSIEEDLELLVSNGQVIDAMNDFRKAFGRLDMANRYEEEQALQRIYTPKSAAGNREMFKETPSTGVRNYFRTHNQHHAWFDTVTRVRGYYDLFLIAPNSDVVYSMFKETDFATNLSIGKWRDTGLSRVFKDSMNAKEPGAVAFVDFQSYEPSDHTPAAFISRKIIHLGRTIGVLVLQMPIGRIRDVMQVTAGMGETGETYIVGPDYLMRSDSRFSESSTILKTEVRTEAVTRVANSESGVGTIDDYRGVPVLSAYRPFTYLGVTWALLAEKDIAEIQQPIDHMLRSIILLSFTIALIVGTCGVLLAKSITMPLSGLSKSVAKFRETHQAEDLIRSTRPDEIGEISRGFHTAAQEVSSYISGINEAREELKRGEAELREREERIRTLLEVSPLGFTLTKLTGEIVFSNGTFRNTICLASDEAVPKDIGDLYQDRQDRKHVVAVLLRDGAISAFETTWKTTDDNLIWVTISAKLIDYDGDEVILSWIDDITDRKRVETEFAAKEAQLRMALENMPGAMVVVDSELNVVLANETYKEYYGDPEGLVAPGNSMRDILKSEIARGMLSGDGTPEDILPEDILKERSSSYHMGETVSFEDRTPDGRDIQLTRTPAPDGHTISVAVDITERKQAEQKLSEQRQTLESVLENIAQAVVATDSNHDLIALNSHFQNLIGYPDEMVTPGTSLEALVQYAAESGFYGEGVVDEQVAVRMTALTSGEPLSVEIAPKDGRYWYCTLQPSPDSGFVMTYTDITERKLAENKLSSAYEVISSSINYASKIQRSILPESTLLDTLLTDHFVLWEPRDVVGGDLYWCRTWGDGYLIMLGDCTGHGVPGAFMTLIATGALDKALTEIPEGHVGGLIQRLHQLVQVTLGQHGTEGQSDDGLELGACYLGKQLDSLIFSGARFDLFIAEDGEISTTKGTKSGIGYKGIAHDQKFEEHHVDRVTNKIFYMTSDGLIDQVGGERGRMFGKKRLKELLMQVQPKTMSDQKDAIYQTMLDYMGNQKRRDDVAVIGFRI